MESVEFKFAGIEFMVELDVSMGDTLKDSVIESVMGVYIWDKETKKYNKVPAVLEEFEHDLKDQIYDAFEEMYENEEAARADMAYDAWREQQWEMKHNQ